jgi:hypothetical protein
MRGQKKKGPAARGPSEGPLNRKPDYPFRAAPATSVRAEDVLSIEAAHCSGITLQRLTRPSNGVDGPCFTRLPCVSTRFEERLRSGPPIVADGGMGTLISGAVPRLRCPEEANLRAPESVVALHASFIRAGAELIETNTFGANRRKLSAHFLEDEFERINSTGVRLAREAREVSGADVFIAGSIGPSGEVERFDASERSEAFSQQAQVLEGRGVDLFMLETFFDLDELVGAIEAVRSVSSLPIVALMTFDADGQTFGGVSAGEAAERLAELDVAAAGDAARRARAGRASERRPREPNRVARGLPPRDARLLRRVRSPGAATRRRHHRRLLRHDPRADHCDQDSDRGESRARRAARRPGARAGRRG